MTAALMILGTLTGAARPADDVFARDNLVAWCIVPFDAKKRTPGGAGGDARAASASSSTPTTGGPSTCRRSTRRSSPQEDGIELTAVWFPAALERGREGPARRHREAQAHAAALGDVGNPAGNTQAEKVAAAAAQVISRSREAAAELGCKVGLYNHGGWSGRAGEPDRRHRGARPDERRHRLQPAPRARPPRPLPGAAGEDEAAPALPEPERHDRRRRQGGEEDPGARPGRPRAGAAEGDPRRAATAARSGSSATRRTTRKPGCGTTSTAWTG